MARASPPGRLPRRPARGSRPTWAGAPSPPRPRPPGPRRLLLPEAGAERPSEGARTAPLRPKLRSRALAGERREARGSRALSPGHALRETEATDGKLRHSAQTKHTWERSDAPAAPRQNPRSPTVSSLILPHALLISSGHMLKRVSQRVPWEEENSEITSF
nr:progesterone receptor-like [Meriones unguiculatus]